MVYYCVFKFNLINLFKYLFCRRVITWLLFISFLVWQPALYSQDKNAALSYRSNIVDTIFGVPVPDPYRWMESQNSDSVKDWLNLQRKITAKEKAKISGDYFELSKRLGSNGASLEYLFKSGPYYFRAGRYMGFFGRLYYRETADGRDMPAYDPSEYAMKDIYSIHSFYASEDGDNIAIIMSKEGSDWGEIQIKDLPRNKNYNDKVRGVKFSPLEWYGDGFFYRRFKTPPNDNAKIEPDSHQQLCYHKIGDKQEDDKVIYNLHDAANTVFAYHVSQNKKYLFINSVIKNGKGWTRIIAYKDLQLGLNGELVPILSVPEQDSIHYHMLDLIEHGLVVQTNYKAPTGRVMLLNMDSLNQMRELLPPYRNTLQSLYQVGHELVGIYSHNLISTLCIFSYEGKLLKSIDYEVGVALQGFGGTPDDSEVIFYKNSFYTPPVEYKLKLKDNTIGNFGETVVGYKESDYGTSIVSYKSKDGTEIPMYLTCKKGIAQDGNNPVILCAFGGFGDNVEPFYNFANIIFFGNGGILAVPLIRGGGEFGSNWHEDGKHLKKQNAVDDFVAAAEYLVSIKVTNKQKLAFYGVGDGALTAAAAINQRPDLGKTAILEKGIYDMLRFQFYTVGRFWQDEYGISTNEVDFKNLIHYSPVHNVKQGVEYPSTLIIAAKNDERPPPFQSYKFLAQLQQKSIGSNPHIMYFQEDSGHNGSGVGERAFALAFICSQLGVSLMMNY
jgi:prolyl oligopeptidase